MSNAVPDEVIVSDDRRGLRLVWVAGADLALSAAHLRASCRCAWCTRDRVLECFAPEPAPSLDGVEALGSHGLHLKFSDGHARGIYPWTYLRDLAAFPISGSRRQDHP